MADHQARVIRFSPFLYIGRVMNIWTGSQRYYGKISHLSLFPEGFTGFSLSVKLKTNFVGEKEFKQYESEILQKPFAERESRQCVWNKPTPWQFIVFQSLSDTNEPKGIVFIAVDSITALSYC